MGSNTLGEPYMMAQLREYDDLKEEELAALNEVCESLSPERVAQDGEVSQADQHMRYIELYREWHVLRLRYHIAMTPDEFESLHYERRRSQ